jgi:hypothetical protein
METIYVSMTNPPTNQPQPTALPDVYLSVRVTTPYHFWNKVENCVNSEEWHVNWKENGKSGTNPHFHVLVSGSKPADAERIRKRLKVAGYTGNRELSVKLCQNGILRAHTHVSHVAVCWALKQLDLLCDALISCNCVSGFSCCVLGGSSYS